MADSAKRLKTSEPATEQLKLPFGMLKAWDRLPSEWNPTGIVDLKVQDGKMCIVLTAQYSVHFVTAMLNYVAEYSDMLKAIRQTHAMRKAGLGDAKVGSVAGLDREGRPKRDRTRPMYTDSLYQSRRGKLKEIINRFALADNQFGVDRSLWREHPSSQILGPILDELVSNLEALMETQAFWNLVLADPKAWRTFLTTHGSLSDYVTTYLDLNKGVRSLLAQLPARAQVLIDAACDRDPATLEKPKEMPLEREIPGLRGRKNAKISRMTLEYADRSADYELLMNFVREGSVIRKPFLTQTMLDTAKDVGPYFSYPRPVDDSIIHVPFTVVEVAVLDKLIADAKAEATRSKDDDADGSGDVEVMEIVDNEDIDTFEATISDEKIVEFAGYLPGRTGEDLKRFMAERLWVRRARAIQSHGDVRAPKTTPEEEQPPADEDYRPADIDGNPIPDKIWVYYDKYKSSANKRDAWRRMGMFDQLNMRQYRSDINTTGKYRSSNYTIRNFFDGLQNNPDEDWSNILTNAVIDLVFDPSQNSHKFIAGTALNTDTQPNSDLSHQSLSVLFDLERGTATRITEHKNSICASMWSHDGRYVITGDFDGKIVVTSAYSEETVRKLGVKETSNDEIIEHKHRTRLLGMAMHQINDSLMTTFSVDEVWAWNFRTGERMADVLSCLPETESYDGENMCCSFLRCNGYEDTFAVGCEAGNARDGHVWFFQMRESRPEFMGHLRAREGPVSAIDSKPRQRAWVYGASMNHIIVFDARVGWSKQAASVNTYQRDVNILAVSPSEYYVAAGCTEDWALVYDVRRMETPTYIFKHDDCRGIFENRIGDDEIGGICSLKWTPEGEFLITGGHDQIIRVWDVGTSGTQARTFSGFKQPLSAVDCTNDCIIGGDDGGNIALWSVKDSNYKLALSLTRGGINLQGQQH